MKKILLAEDHADLRRFVERGLKKAGYSVVSCPDGDAAYEMLKEDVFDLLLTDIKMPGIDGIELVRRAQKIDPDLIVMFITGFAAVALDPANKTPKDAKILSKPFHLKDLVSEVKKLLPPTAK